MAITPSDRDKRRQMKLACVHACREASGYSASEADAWAQGVADALTMVARLPNDEDDMIDMARHLVRL